MTDPANPSHQATNSTDNGNADGDASQAVPPSSPAGGVPPVAGGTADPAARSQTPLEKFENEVARTQSLDDHEPEESLWSGSYSPKAMIGSWIGLAALSIALLVAVGFIEQLTIGIALIVIAVLWSLVGLNYARRRLGMHYELTSQRFIHKSGILTRRTDRIEVIDIDDVSYEQGPIQRVFGVGKINITSSDRSDPELELLGIAKVSEVAGLIDDTRRAERRKRSLHIESI